MTDDPHSWVTDAPPAELRGSLARMVLDSFEFTGRFVDDLTSAEVQLDQIDF